MCVGICVWNTVRIHTFFTSGLHNNICPNYRLKAIFGLLVKPRVKVALKYLGIRNCYVVMRINAGV